MNRANAEGGIPLPGIFCFELGFPHFFTLNFVFIYHGQGTVTCLSCTDSGSHTTCESDRSNQTLKPGSPATSQVFSGTLPMPRWHPGPQGQVSGHNHPTATLDTSHSSTKALTSPDQLSLCLEVTVVSLSSLL